MANPTATLTSLLRESSIEDHEEIVKACNAVLKSSKGNLDALHTRAVALLKLDRFDDALRSLDEGGDKLAEKCVLEKAYALYKTGKLEEAEKLVQGSTERGLKHIAAQVAYRAERFEDASDIYKELSAQAAGIEGEENDLRINSSAIDAQLEWQGNGHLVEQIRKKPGREDLEAFETSYNAACGCISRGDLNAGSILLKRARDLCESLDELSDEEKRAEVLPIMVQQAYVFTKLGKLQEAETVQKMINVAEYAQKLSKARSVLTRSSVPEPPTRVIAQNNALASSPDQNPYMTQKIFEEVPKLKDTEKLFQVQASILRRNKYAIDLLTLKYPGVAHSTATKILSSPTPTISPFLNTLSVINAAAHAKNESGKSGFKHILPLLERRPTDVGLVLVMIQLYLLSANLQPATILLESFFKRLEEINTPEALSARYAPGLIALLVSLYSLAGRRAPIKTELAKAATYWQTKSNPSLSLLRAAGASLLESSSPEDHSAAGEIFSSLRKQDPNDRIAIAGYVASYATTDKSKVSSDLDKLTPVARLTSGIDASALLQAGIPSLPTPTTQSSKKRGAEQATPKEPPAKKHKIRESRKPKDFDENKKMDPERWLPLRDRSSYRPKGKKGKKKAMDLTQGGAVAEESLELAGGAGSIKVEKAGVVSGANKKGKKKGKK